MPEEKEMSEQNYKSIQLLADTIRGEINRMCVTDDMGELDDMFMYAIENIVSLHRMKGNDLREARYKHERIKV